MALTSASKLFPLDAVVAGTTVDTWLGTLTVTTTHGVASTIVGGTMVLITIIYE